jgi:hypothetical protein
VAVLDAVDRLPREALRAVQAVALARSWPSWKADYDAQTALDKAWRQPRASLHALAMSARHAAAMAVSDQAATI